MVSLVCVCTTNRAVYAAAITTLKTIIETSSSISVTPASSLRRVNRWRADRSSRTGHRPVGRTCDEPTEVQLDGEVGHLTAPRHDLVGHVRDDAHALGLCC